MSSRSYLSCSSAATALLHAFPGNITWPRVRFVFLFSCAITCSEDHLVAAPDSRAFGTPIAWGSSPIAEVPPGITNATQVSLGAWYEWGQALALRADGKVASWGSPIGQMPTGLTNIVAVAAGGNTHAVALRNDGTVVQWGYTNGIPPDPVPGNVAAIAANSGYTLLLRSNGSVTLLGNMGGLTNLAPVPTGVSAITAGGFFGMGLKSNGTVELWDGPGGMRATMPENLSNVVAISAGQSHAVALDSGGLVTAWGYACSDACQLPTDLTNVLSIRAGHNTSLAVISDGTLRGWGETYLNGLTMFPRVTRNVIEAEITDSAGCAICRVDDTHLPGLYGGLNGYNTISYYEGDETNNLVIWASLTAPYFKPVTLAYSTTDGTAKANRDYVPVAGTIVIQPFTQRTNITIPIIGNLLAESNKTFFVNFLQVSNAVLVNTQVVVTIYNDDQITVAEGIAFTQVATNIQPPTTMQFTPDGRLLLCEQSGVLRLVTNGALVPTPLLTLNVTTEDCGEAGLLAVACHPQFQSNGFFYVHYTVPGSQPAWTVHNRISRFHMAGSLVESNSEVVILELDDVPYADVHNGGAINFGADGKLYVGVGDNGNSANSQTLTNLLGKILRINDDGTIPVDNPFYNAATGKNRAIWALGLRNPFSFAFQPGTGRMLIDDVGLQSWEEIEQGAAGANYGWPYAEGFSTNTTYQNPVFAYPHGTNSAWGTAIVGAAFPPQTGIKFPQSYQDSFFFADYGTGCIARLSSSNTVETVVNGFWHPVDLKFGPDGYLYCLTRRGFDSALYRIGYDPGVQILSASRSASNSWQIHSTARTGHQYVFEASSNLSTWTRIATNTAAGTTVDFTDNKTNDSSQRFYRLRE